MNAILHFLGYVILLLFVGYLVLFVVMGFPHPDWAKKALSDVGSTNQIKIDYYER